MKLGYKTTILIFGVLLLLVPLFFERIYDDEAIFWNISRSINDKGLSEISHLGRMPLAILIVSPLLRLNDSILVPRIISALTAIASAILIFEIVKNYSNNQAAFISAILFIFSFQTIRFATRSYLDIYGTFFFLLSFYLIQKDRRGLAGFSFALAMLSRELWFALYPFMMLYLWKRNKAVREFIVWSVLPIVVFFAYIHITVGIVTYLTYSGFAQSSYYLAGNLQEAPLYLIQSWAEFLIVQIITFIGFVGWVWNKRNDILIIILPQFLIVSLIEGFIYNGALTQYTIGLQASMALLAGPGILQVWKKYFKTYRLEPLLVSLLILQFLIFSCLATALSFRGALGIHDFGYWYDEEVIGLLNQKASNETIAGLHGAFIKNAKDWVWLDRYVDRILEVEPDWYVIVEPQTVKFKTDPSNIKEVELYKIGPYIVLHSNPRGHLHELIEPNEEFSKWAFRG